MARDTGSQHMGEIRFRLPLPIIIPLVALVVIAALAIGFSRVLLSIPSEAAVVVALATAINILVACWVIAARPRMSMGRMLELAAVAAYPIVIGIAIAVLNVGEGTAGEELETTPAGSGPLKVVAENIAFKPNTLELPANQDVDLKFQNEDSVQHNIHIFETDAAERSLFEGELISASSTTYQLPAFEEGNYYFRCDVHPTMEGTVEVRGAEEAGEGGAQLEDGGDTTEEPPT